MAAARPVEESLRLAYAAFAQGRVDETRRRCAELLELAASDARVLHLAAAAELSAGNPAEGLTLVERAIAANPQDPRQHHTRGLALRALQRPVEAAASFREAVRLDPRFADGHAALGRALLAAGDSQGAQSALERAVEIEPGAVDAHNDLGVVHLQRVQMAEAEQSFRRAIEVAPGRSHAWNNLGNALRTSGRRDEALAAFRRATQGTPPLAGAWMNLGNMLREADMLEEGTAYLDRALAMEPSSAPARLSAAIARLLAGDLERGWADYAWRGGKPDPAMRERLAGAARVDLLGEQGLGDVLFFLRWAAGLAARGTRLGFRGDARLFPLLAPLGWFESFQAPEAAPAGDAPIVSVGDLPWATGTGAAYPEPVRFQPTQANVDAARQLLAAAGPPPYVALAWRAGIPSSGGGEHLFKEADAALLAKTLGGVDATFISVQREPREGETQQLAALTARRMLDASSLNDDLGAMLGLLSQVDGYAGVSSTNAHLLAGLGKEAWLLVPQPPEWRYGRAGAVSPWFPSFKLYRQARNGDWAEAMAALGADLAARFGR